MTQKNTRLELPTADQMLAVKRELNTLLWTNDAPNGDYSSRFSFAKAPLTNRNIQCRTHARISACMLLRRGYTVTWRNGEAAQIENAASGRPEDKSLNHIAIHSWVTIRGHGAVDLSLFGESENPLVYCNREPTGRWVIQYGNGLHEIRDFTTKRKQGCFYLTRDKCDLHSSELKKVESYAFDSAVKRGIPLRVGHLVDHVEGMLEGTRVSLAGRPQEEAWRILADGVVSEGARTM